MVQLAFSRAWRFLTSMSLGLTLLSFIIAFSIIGTFNPDVFSSSWFFITSGLFTLNMLGCTVKRIKGLTRKEKDIPFVLHQEGSHRYLNLGKCSEEKVLQEVRLALKQFGFKVNCQEFREGQFFTGSKNTWAVLGSPLLHLAMVLVILGSISGVIWGQEKYYQVKVPGQVELVKDGFPINLNVKKFTLDTYADGSPKQYTSFIEVLSTNQKVLEKAVSVNNPLSYQGVKVYQTSYGNSLQGAVRDQNHSFDFELEEGQRIYLGGPAMFELEVRWPRYIIYSKGVPFTMGIAELGEPIKLLNSEVVFTNRSTYTGLQVKRDPGLPLIWAGFILFLLALPMRLYVKPNKIWVLISQGQSEIAVKLAAQHRLRNKNQEEQLLQKLSGLTREECTLQT